MSHQDLTRRRLRSGKVLESRNESSERDSLQNTSGSNWNPDDKSMKVQSDGERSFSDHQNESISDSPKLSPGYPKTQSSPQRRKQLYPDLPPPLYSDRSGTSPAKNHETLTDSLKRSPYYEYDDDSNDPHDNTDFLPPGKSKDGNRYGHVQSTRTMNSLTLEPTRQSSPRNFDDEMNNYSCIIVAVFVLFLVIFAVLWIQSLFSEQVPENQKTQPLDKYELFSNDIKDLQDHFPSQKIRLWKSVKASSRHVLKEPNSTYPSVILLASQVENPRLSFCIAEKIASSFVKSHSINPGQVPMTDIELIKDSTPSEQKLKLDKDIQTALQKPNGKAYIIQNLQTLSPQAALLLHGLCDGDNAPYKDVMILMTLEVKKTIPAMTAYDVENYLTELWTREVEYDKISAVMSRISNNLVILQQELPSDVEKACSVY